jgi:hypothetical protein
MIKKENKMKKEEQKYNGIYNALVDKMGHFPSNNWHEDMNTHTKQHKLTHDTKCHLYKNDILIIKIIKIKCTTYHNTIKHTQQNYNKILSHISNTQTNINKKMTLDTKCHFDNNLYIKYSKNIETKMIEYSTLLHIEACTNNTHKIIYNTYI